LEDLCEVAVCKSTPGIRAGCIFKVDSVKIWDADNLISLFDWNLKISDLEKSEKKDRKTSSKSSFIRAKSEPFEFLIDLFVGCEPESDASEDEYSDARHYHNHNYARHYYCQRSFVKHNQIDRKMKRNNPSQSEEIVRSKPQTSAEIVANFVRKQRENQMINNGIARETRRHKRRTNRHSNGSH
jgi:hypothetical protein